MEVICIPRILHIWGPERDLAERGVSCSPHTSGTSVHALAPIRTGLLEPTLSPRKEVPTIHCLTHRKDLLPQVAVPTFPGGMLGDIPPSSVLFKHLSSMLRPSDAEGNQDHTWCLKGWRVPYQTQGLCLSSMCPNFLNCPPPIPDPNS